MNALLRVATDNLAAPWPSRREGGQLVGDILRNWLDATPAQRAADALLDHPVGEALRCAVTTLGRRLHEIGGTKAMQDTLYRVAELDPANNARRIGIMDHRWDGIGDWTA